MLCLYEKFGRVNVARNVSNNNDQTRFTSQIFAHYDLNVPPPLFTETLPLRRLVAQLVRVPHPPRGEAGVHRVLHKPAADQVSSL